MFFLKHNQVLAFQGELEQSSPLYYAGAWVNIVSQSKRRARGGSDGLSGTFGFVTGLAFRGHILSSYVERRTKKGEKFLNWGGGPLPNYNAGRP
jgi:hypothetical protein